jgi:hypothetical protein
VLRIARLAAGHAVVLRKVGGCVTVLGQAEFTAGRIALGCRADRRLAAWRAAGVKVGRRAAGIGRPAADAGQTTPSTG